MIRASEGFIQNIHLINNTEYHYRDKTIPYTNRRDFTEPRRVATCNGAGLFLYEAFRKDAGTGKASEGLYTAAGIDHYHIVSSAAGEYRFAGDIE